MTRRAEQRFEVRILAAVARQAGPLLIGVTSAAVRAVVLVAVADTPAPRGPAILAIGKPESKRCHVAPGPPVLAVRVDARFLTR